MIKVPKEVREEWQREDNVSNEEVDKICSEVEEEIKLNCGRCNK